jgi:DNA-binding CsgD family transcriptional regulator
MHAIDFVKALEMRPHCPIRHSDGVRDLLVGPALGDQFNDCELGLGQRAELARSRIRMSLPQCELRLATLVAQAVASPSSRRSPRLSRQRIALLTYDTDNCTFGQMAADSSRRQPSQRQRDVLDLLTWGMPNKEIGVRLGISERGVKHHVSRLLALYAVANRAELIAFVLRQEGSRRRK